MIKVDNVDVWGFDHAIRGMRNPMNSWDKSDSEEKYWCTTLGPNENPHYCNDCGYDMCSPYNNEPEYIIGPNDLDLMKRLYKAGTEHRKYLRQIFVSMDITAPLYWWKEFDTYKVGTTANSCSTMHKIHDKEFTLDDFSHEHLIDYGIGIDKGYSIIPSYLLQSTIDVLNLCRKRYLETKDKKYWWQLIQLLPSSYNQRRTVTMNYENVMSMIKQRTGHKLDEWNTFVEFLKTLPYIKEITNGTEA